MATDGEGINKFHYKINPMKNTALFVCLLLCGAMNAQTFYSYTVDEFGVDSVFLNETVYNVTGANTQTVVNRLFFSDTAQLTQHIEAYELQYTNMTAEWNRLRNDAVSMGARVDSMNAARTLIGLSMGEEIQGEIRMMKVVAPPPTEKKQSKAVRRRKQ